MDVTFRSTSDGKTWISWRAFGCFLAFSLGGQDGEGVMIDSLGWVLRWLGGEARLEV